MKNDMENDIKRTYISRGGPNSKLYNELKSENKIPELNDTLNRLLTASNYIKDYLNNIISVEVFVTAIGRIYNKTATHSISSVNKILESEEYYILKTIRKYHNIFMKELSGKSRFVKDIISLVDECYSVYDIVNISNNITDEQINFLLDTLTEKEKNIVKDYYFNNITLKEISKKLNQSKQRISQIIHEALRRLKNQDKLIYLLNPDLLDIEEALNHTKYKNSLYLEKRAKLLKDIDDELKYKKILSKNINDLEDYLNSIKKDFEVIQQTYIKQIYNQNCLDLKELKKLKNILIEDEFTNLRVIHCFNKAGVYSIYDLITKYKNIESLYELPSLGWKSLDIVTKYLLEHDYIDKNNNFIYYSIRV